VDWNLVACARRHRTYAPDEPDLRAHLTVDTPAGAAWRCLRCGLYVLGPPQGEGPADEAPAVLRGQELRDAIVLRLLAVERYGRGLLLLFGAYLVIRFRADRDRVRRAYFHAVTYSLRAVTRFVTTYGDDDLVVVMLGDHQPATIVSGSDAGHDVPVSLIARDPDVLAGADGWGWEPGLRPRTDAPVWRMDAFRDRFVATYSQHGPD